MTEVQSARAGLNNIFNSVSEDKEFHAFGSYVAVSLNNNHWCVFCFC
jgi:hypothetical protein